METEEFKVSPAYQELPMETSGNRVYLEVSIGITGDDVIHEKFQIDLGNGGTLDITSPTAMKYGLSNKVRKKLRYRNVSGGIGGEIQGSQFRAKFIQIGDFKINLPVIDFSSDTGGALAKDEIGGLLGNAILERFKIVFDFKRSKLYLKPLNEVSPFHSTLTGFSYTDRRKEHKGLLITGLFQNTEATKTDIRIGDVITRINGSDVSTMEVTDWQTTFSRIHTKVELVILRDGELLSKELTLKDYL
jgi:hypothetical protein